MVIQVSGVQETSSYGPHLYLPPHVEDRQGPRSLDPARGGTALRHQVVLPGSGGVCDTLYLYGYWMTLDWNYTMYRTVDVCKLFHKLMIKMMIMVKSKIFTASIILTICSFRPLINALRYIIKVTNCAK